MRWIKNSFSAGELSPELNARTDLAKYGSGAAVMRNFMVGYRGGAISRPGTRFMGYVQRGQTPQRARMVPFAFSTGQSFPLVFSNQTMRAMTSSGYVTMTPLAISAISQTNPATVTVPNTSGQAPANNQEVSIAGADPSVSGSFIAEGCTVSGGNLTFSLYTPFGAPVDATAMPAYVGGGTMALLYSLAVPYLDADMPLVRYADSDDVMTFCHPSYPPADLTRASDTSWALTNITFAPTVTPPTSVTATGTQPSAVPAGTPGGAYQFFSKYNYVVTAFSSQTGEESLPTPLYTATNALPSMSLYSGVSVSLSWPPVAGATSYNVYRTDEIDGASTATANTTGAGVPAPGASFGLVGATVGTTFSDSDGSPDFSQGPPQGRSPFANGRIGSVTVTAGGTGWDNQTQVVAVDAVGQGAILMPVIVSGVITEVVVMTPGFDYSGAATIMAYGNGTGATFTYTLTSNNNWPGAVCYYQQRKVFAATPNKPTTFFMTQPGLFQNMDVSIPSRESDAITETLASQEVNSIKHLTPVGTGLMMLTASGAWLVNGGTNGPDVAPDTITSTEQAFIAASDLRPLQVAYDTLYEYAQGGQVLDAQFNFYFSQYVVEDRAQYANHLFINRRIVQWCYQRKPWKILWAVLDNGALLSMTYEREDAFALGQPGNLLASWARHDTQGLFRGVVCIPENGAVDGVYFIVERFLNGQWIETVERLDNRNLGEDYSLGLAPDPVHAWSVDCGLNWPQTTPQGNLYPTAVSGDGIQFFSDIAVPTLAVGDILRAGGGTATITEIADSQHFTANVTIAIQAVTPSDPNMTPLPIPAGGWSFAPLTQVINGLQHLNGKFVTGTADGNVISPRMVTNGSITLDQPASQIVVGLGFTCQLQPMPLDLPGGGETIQGVRKNISSMALILNETRGISVGQSFDDLIQVKYLGGQAPTETPPLFSGQSFVNLPSEWTETGQIVIQQDQPLPAMVLGFVYKFALGDQDLPAQQPQDA